MKPQTLPITTKARQLLLLAVCLLSYVLADAQAPTSLSYPTPNVYIANVSSVFLSPNVAGNVSGYTISPAINTATTGLTFDANTGILSGTPIAAMPLTNYTVTATGGTPSGSIQATFSLLVNSNYFNNSYSAVNFGGGTGTSAVTIVNVHGDGTAAGDTVLYKNVARPNGQQIDAFVITKSLTNGTFLAFDQTSMPTTGSFTGNQLEYFSPQLNFTGAGAVNFNFQFILGNSFNETTHQGAQAVTLQNVKVNTYDIDGNGTPGSNQYAEFSSFDSSELGGYTIDTASYNTLTNLTHFSSKISGNSVPLLADSTRVRLTCNNISNFNVVLGAGPGGGNAYFVLDFSTGPAFASVKTPAPSLDLSTTLPGVNNAAASCAAAIAFTNGTGATNIKMQPPTLNELMVAYDNTTANIRDAANEVLLINGGTGTNAVPLNFTAATTNTVTLGGVTYLITRETSGGQNILHFTNNAGGTFTLAQGEALLDALQYNNSATLPTAGDRNFTVNVRNAAFKSPDAVFTASVNCVTVSGNIFVDANGLTDNTVNAITNGTFGQLAANGAYAVLTNTAGTVLAVQGVAAGGAYSFGKRDPGTYIILISNSANPGAIFTTPTYPVINGQNFFSTGENLGSGTGSDLLADGKLRVTLGSANINNANFGIELAPTAANSTFSGIANPGGMNNYALPNGTFTTGDQDGAVVNITITSFPTGINYLKVGNTVYTNGGTCPAQTSCTAWPGSLIVPFTNGNPSVAISVDPINEGAQTVTIPFTAKDNDSISTAGATVTLNFAGSVLTISGNVWNDANGDGINSGSTEGLTNAAGSGQQLYAYLVQTNTAKTYAGAPTIYAVQPVGATADYSFSNVAAANDYVLHIVTQATAPVVGALASSVTPALAPTYTGVSTSKGSPATIVTGLNTPDPTISFSNLTASATASNIGIERRAVGADYTVGRQANTGVATPIVVPAAAFAATDGEDAPAGYPGNLLNRKVTLNPATNGTLSYNGTPVLTPFTTTGNNFDPTRLTFVPATTTATSVSFTYSVYDNAGIPSIASTITLPLDAALTISGNVWDDANGDAINAGESFTNAGSALYATLTDANGNVLEVSSAIPATTGAYTLTKATTNQAYNVILTTTVPTIGSRLTAASLPGNWVSTGVNRNGAANMGVSNGILNLTTPASGTAVTNQNFGIEQRAVADAKSFAISGNVTGAVTAATVAGTASGSGTYNFRIAMSGTGSSGPVPGILTGNDADGNNGNNLVIGDGTPLKLSIDPSSYIAVDKNGVTIPQGILLQYNGVQLTAGGCQGSNVGNALCSSYNSATGAWEIANYNASQLSILSKTGTKTQSFQYSWIDGAGKQGIPATYGITTTVVPLPVDLIAFTAALKGGEVVLNWQVANEQRLSNYTVERSADAHTFSAIGELAAHNMAIADAYTYTDATPLNGTSYYRLRIAGQDGTYKYSQVQTVSRNAAIANTLQVYPNPAPAQSEVTIALNAAGNGMIFLMDQSGKLVQQQALNHIDTTTTIRLQALPAGIYLLEVVTEGRTAFTKLFIQ